MTTPADKEKAKRLQPTSEVLRELFLKSGNLCAFPDCSRPIMNKDGQFVGQVCHIEAAEEGGERFNSNQTNEQRRAFSNLMLMCYEHHVETDDVQKFPAKRMHEIKVKHEQKVFDFIEKSLLTVTDHTKSNNPRPTRDCSRIDQVLGWGHNTEQLVENAKLLNGLLATLSKIPLPARQLLLVIVERATRDYGSSEMVNTREVQLACNLDSPTMTDLCTILEKYETIESGGEDDYGNARILLSELDGWPVWTDLRAFVKDGSATLAELIVDLNFSLLDIPPNQPVAIPTPP